MSQARGYAVFEPDGSLTPFEYTLGEIGPEEVEIRVEYCGVCRSDLGMIGNHFGSTQFPLIPGHEVIGTVEALGPVAKGLKIGQRVGLGWYSGSCMHCRSCLAGQHNVCDTAESTLFGRHGGFADRVRCSWEWAVPIPDGVDPRSAGPLLCAGVTVFDPLIKYGIKPLDRVGVIGIGGLGHLALKFLNKWGCDVTAFTSSAAKEADAIAMGAHHVVNSSDEAAIGKIAGSLDLVLSTVDVSLNWDAYLAALRPGGRLHMVGMVVEPVSVSSFSVMGQKSLSGSPSGSPGAIQEMLEFCARHDIQPIVEEFPMAEVNAAIAHLESGKARYRIVLAN
jgi:uncharacterized zinc-type alcohol dehydrogenase-like protein